MDWAAVVKNAMDSYSVEIAGGLGPTVGKIWRVGIMGFNAQPQNVAIVLTAIKDGLKKQGFLKSDTLHPGHRSEASGEAVIAS